MEYSEAGGKLIHEKNQKQKISWHCPFNYLATWIWIRIQFRIQVWILTVYEICIKKFQEKVSTLYNIKEFTASLNKVDMRFSLNYLSSIERKSFFFLKRRTDCLRDCLTLAAGVPSSGSSRSSGTCICRHRSLVTFHLSSIAISQGGSLHWYGGVTVLRPGWIFGSSLDCALQSPQLAVSLCTHYHAVGYGQSGW